MWRAGKAVVYISLLKCIDRSRINLPGPRSEIRLKNDPSSPFPHSPFHLALSPVPFLLGHHHAVRSSCRCVGYSSNGYVVWDRPRHCCRDFFPWLLRSCPTHSPTLSPITLSSIAPSESVISCFHQGADFCLGSQDASTHRRADDPGRHITALHLQSHKHRQQRKHKHKHKHEDVIGRDKALLRPTFASFLGVCSQKIPNITTSSMIMLLTAILYFPCAYSSGFLHPSLSIWPRGEVRVFDVCCALVSSHA